MNEFQLEKFLLNKEVYFLQRDVHTCGVLTALFYQTEIL